MFVALLAALCSALFWAAVVLTDRITLTRVMRSPVQLLITSSAISLVSGLLTLWQAPDLPSTGPALRAFVGGIAFMLSNATFFAALRRTDEASEVAAWDCVHPVIIAVLTTFLGQGLGTLQWVAMLLLVGSLVAMELRPDGRPLGTSYRALLLGHAMLMAVSFLLFDQALGAADHAGLFGWYAVGLGSGALVGLLPSQRRAARGLLTLLPRWWWIFAGAEVFALAALYSETWSFGRLHPAVATAVAGAYPLLVYLLEPVVRRGLKLPLAIFPPHRHPLVPVGALVAFSFGLILISF